MICYEKDCLHFINNEPCYDNITFCNYTLEKHDEKIRISEQTRMVDKITQFINQNSCNKQCYDAGVGNKDCLECDGTKISVIDLMEILNSLKEKPMIISEQEINCQIEEFYNEKNDKSESLYEFTEDELRNYQEQIRIHERAKVLNELMDIRDDLPLLDADHWCPRDDEALTKLFAEYQTRHLK